GGWRQVRAGLGRRGLAPAVGVVRAACLSQARGWALKGRPRPKIIPAVKLGKYLRFDRDEPIAWAAEFNAAADGPSGGPSTRSSPLPLSPLSSPAPPAICLTGSVTPHDQTVPAWSLTERRSPLRPSVALVPKYA